MAIVNTVQRTRNTIIAVIVACYIPPEKVLRSWINHDVKISTLIEVLRHLNLISRVCLRVSRVRESIFPPLGKLTDDCQTLNRTTSISALNCVYLRCKKCTTSKMK